jgi:hypothetical protein
MKITIDIDPTMTAGSVPVSVSEKDQIIATTANVATEGTLLDAGACAGLPPTDTPSLATRLHSISRDAGPGPVTPTHTDDFGSITQPHSQNRDYKKVRRL